MPKGLQGFQPGHKLGGRKPGSKSRSTLMAESLEAAGFDIAKKAIELWDDNAEKPEIRLRILQLLADFTTAKPQAPKTQEEGEEQSPRPLEGFTVQEIRALLLKGSG